MLISGYMFYFSFQNRTLKDLLVHRTQSLLQPIVFCSFFNYVVTEGIISIMRGHWFGSSWMSSLPSLWFLWSVLAASIAVSVICKSRTTPLVKFVLLATASLLMCIFPNGEMNLFMYPFFVIGFYYAKYKDKIPPVINKARYLSIPLYVLLMFFYEKKHYIYTSGLFNKNYSTFDMLSIDIYRWIVGLVGSVFFLTILQIFFTKISTCKNKFSPYTGLCVLGKKSIQIYTLSVPFLSIYLSVFFPKILTFLNIDNIFVKNMYLYSFVFTFLLSVLYSFALCMISKLLETVKISKIMFRR